MSTVKSAFVFGISATLMLGFGGNAKALSIYASDSSSQIGLINIETGEFSSFARTNAQFTDIALTEDRKLFGTTQDSLFSINQTTGLSTRIGRYDTGGMNSLGFTTSNTLYGASSTGGLYQIDINTGSNTLVEGTSGFRSAGDIVFDATQNAFWGTSSSRHLFKIGLDGKMNQIGYTGNSIIYSLFLNEGILYGITKDGEQVTLNMTTGASTFDKQITGDHSQIWGVASLPSTGGESQSVPEPTSLLGLFGITAVGALFHRKRQNSTRF